MSKKRRQRNKLTKRKTEKQENKGDYSSLQQNKESEMKHEVETKRKKERDINEG